jgi:hypothetical protein
MIETNKEPLAALSREGRNVLADLEKSCDELRAALKGNARGITAALYQAAKFGEVLDAIDGMGAGLAAEGAGPDVPAEEASRTGELLWIDPDRKCFSVTLRAAATEHVANGVAFVIAGAGATLADLVAELPAWRGQMGLNGLIVQFVGIDRQHWAPDEAEKLLELNLLQTAAIQVLNSALNETGHMCVVISHGFGCWVVNRALQGLPVEQVWYAHNLQIDALGSPEVLADLTSAKKGGFGAICHVQGDAARAELAGTFGVPEAMLKSLPVDISA